MSTLDVTLVYENQPDDPLEEQVFVESLSGDLVKRLREAVSAPDDAPVVLVTTLPDGDDTEVPDRELYIGHLLYHPAPLAAHLPDVLEKWIARGAKR